MRTIKLFTLLVLLSWLVSGCSVQNVFSHKHKDKSIVDSAFMIAQNINYQNVIHRDCHLSISVWNHDDISVGSVFSIYNSNEVYGKWVSVNAQGKVTLPTIGEVYLEGLTVAQATDTLRAQYARYIKEPVVVVRIQNMHVTVMGEVIHPGVYNLEVENTTLLEAISKAGGFDFYAQKTKIKILRQIEGVVHECQLDITTEYSAQNRNIKIISGDIIIIPTRHGKMWDKKVTTLIPIASAISAIALLYTVLK